MRNVSEQQIMFRWIDYVRPFDPPRRAITDLRCLECGEFVAVEEFGAHVREKHGQ